MRLLLCILVASACGCDLELAGGSNPGRPGPITEILEVRIDPNPVAVGDTATFTCVIRDSLTTGFSYYWGFSGPAPDTQGIELSSVEWVADVTPGQWRHGVSVHHPDKPQYDTVNREFLVEVIEKQLEAALLIRTETAANQGLHTDRGLVGFRLAPSLVSP